MALAVIQRRMRHLGQYLLAQGASQLFGTGAGLLCVRALPIAAYSQYSVIFAMVGSLVVLTDVGFSGTLSSLVGEQLDNVDLITDYVASIRILRQKLLYVISPLAAVVFLWLTHRQAWPLSLTLSMLVMLLMTLWLSVVSASYGAVLLLKRDRNYYYRVQLWAGAIRLVGIAALMALHCLDAILAVAVGVIASALLARMYYLRAQSFLVQKRASDQKLQIHVIRLALPNIPSTIFYALQGQISIFLITYFGHARGVAGVGALGRIGQLFLLVSQMNPILIDPFFASLARKSLAKAYLYTVSTAVLAVLSITCATMLWPRSLLIILGPKYEGLTHEIVWTVAAAGASYLSGLLWSIHVARRFVYWWATWMNIALLTIVQIGFALTVDLSTVRGVVIMGFAGALAGLLINAAVGVAGFVHGPRPIQRAN